jgi:hypothetical protein
MTDMKPPTSSHMTGNQGVGRAGPIVRAKPAKANAATIEGVRQLAAGNLHK